MNLFSDEAPIVAGFVWALAAWTISVHIAVATGGSFTRLWVCSPIVIAIAGVGWFVSVRGTADSIAFDEENEESKPRSILWLIAATAVVLTYLLGYSTFCLTALIFLLGAWINHLLRASPAIKGTPKIIRSRADNLGCPLYSRGGWRWADGIRLAALCAAAVFITLLLHQPDIDDAFYISVAADAHRHPDRAIWSTDTIHDDPKLPVFLPIYKAEAYEYLIALTAKLLQISSVRAAHTALPIAFSIFVALAWAMLARTIDPKRWLAIAAVTVVISIFAGATKPGPANYAFTRLQQGKSVMVSAIVPILCVYAFRLATLGGWRNAVMLAATQIAGVGLSSTSIVIGPAVVCAIGFFCLPLNGRRSLRHSSAPLSPRAEKIHHGGTEVTERKRDSDELSASLDLALSVLFLPLRVPLCLRGEKSSRDNKKSRHTNGEPGQSLPRLLLILATCLYPLSMALLMRGKMLAVDWLAHTPAQPADTVLTHVLGDRAQLWFFLATLVAAWAVAPRRSQALLLAPCILLLGVMINPIFTHLLQTGVLTPNTYWRGLWVLPWLVWSATFICGLSALVGSVVGGKELWLSRATALLFGSMVLAILLGRHPIWRHQNGTAVHFCGLAVDEPEYTVAKKLAVETPPGCAALAPEVVACWTAVQDVRPPLIFVRSFYTQSTAEGGGIEDTRFRNQLGEIAGKKKLGTADAAQLLIGIKRYGLGAIALFTTAGDEAANALRKAGFVEQTVGEYSIWIRPQR